jgi:hypothetical protein
MANNNASPSRPGQDNLAGDVRALFLKLSAGEIIAQFNAMNIMAPLVRNKSIQGGKSVQFKVSGRAQAKTHVPGTNIFDAGNGLLSLIAMSERVIFIDNKLIAATLIDDLDEALNDVEVRGTHNTEIAEALAVVVDQILINTVILAARASSTITGLNGGAVVTDPDMETSGVALVNALFAAAQNFDEKSVPKQGRIALVRSSMYYNMIRDPAVSIAATSPTVTQATVGYPLLNSNLSPGNGNFAKAQLVECAGFTVMVSQHIPDSNILSSDALFGSDPGGLSEFGNVYYGDFSATSGVCFHRSAVGRVTMKAMSLASEYDMNYDGYKTLGKLAMGAGVLQPESACELATA